MLTAGSTWTGVPPGWAIGAGDVPGTGPEVGGDPSDIRRRAYFCRRFWVQPEKEWEEG